MRDFERGARDPIVRGSRAAVERRGNQTRRRVGFEPGRERRQIEGEMVAAAATSTTEPASVSQAQEVEEPEEEKGT